MNCPDPKVLLAFGTGELSETAAEGVIPHLSACPDCQATLQTFVDADDTLIAKLRSPAVEDPYANEPQRAELATRAASLVTGNSATADLPTLENIEPADLGNLGEYHLLEKLGEGGMGAVYKARQIRLKKIVALKVLPKERTTDQRAVMRFEREMEAVGQLSHPNIVQAHDARDIEGTTVLVMEYVDGKDLSKVVKEGGALRIADACELVRQTALGLQYAHEHGMVHRDIKPSNLMLTRQGQVKILDMGLALLSADQDGGGELTSTGAAMGTSDYMAPEQVSDAHSVDIRADIYSLGCTLYKLLTGQAPFSGPDYMTHAEKLVGHLKETPAPVRKLRSDVPAKLAAVIERMMAKSPDARFATPADAAEAIAPFAAGCNLAQVAAGSTEPHLSPATKDTDANRLPRKGKARNELPASETESLKPRMQDWFRKPPRPWIAVGGAAFFAVVLFGILIKLQTSEGTLIVEVDDPTATVQVLNERDEVVIQRKGENGSLTIGVAPGKGRVRLVKDDVELIAKDFTLVSGGKTIIDARIMDEPKTTTPDSIPNPPTPDTSAPPLAIAPFDAKTAKEHQEAWAKHLKVPVEITNSIGMKLVLIPPGEYIMGSPKELIEDYPNVNWYIDYVSGEGPQHRVRINKPYWLGVTEVTQYEYERVMGSNPSRFGGDPKRPVEQVSWDNAVEFCRRLAELPEEKAAKRRYGLPTEAQWEYACRAGSTGRWCFGDSELGLVDYGWFNVNADGKTHPVGQKRANAFGLYDMYGNVWEWCQDWYDRTYYAKSPTDDPMGPLGGSARVARGGFRYEGAGLCRSANRDDQSSAKGGNRDVGFRVFLIMPDTAAERATFVRTNTANPQSLIPNPPSPPPAVAPFDEKKAKEYQEAWAKYLGVPVEITNSIGMKLVLIPPGEYMMGSPEELIDEELKRPGKDVWYTGVLPSEGPQHRVRITKPFYLGVYEVTQDEYRRITGLNPSEFSATGKRKEKVIGEDTKRFPVDGVSWDDVVEFCRKLSELPSERAANRQYGLPSEAQWEYACRAGTTGRYNVKPNHSGESKQAQENEPSDHGWFRDNGGRTNAVGGKRPSNWGLYDMHGNVFEWCQDWYDKYYYARSPVDDPCGPVSGTERVSRGGGSRNLVWYSRSAWRGAFEPKVRAAFIGFRVCMVIPEAAAERAKLANIENTNSQSPTPNPPSPPPAIAPFDEKKAKEYQEAWAKHLGVPVEITNSIGMKLVLIPPGEFMMGSPEELIEEELKAPNVDDWYKSQLPGEGPRHRVRITRPFYLGMHEVTQEEFQRVMGKNPSEFSANGKGKDKVAGQDTKRFPVENVSWQDADAFCSRLSEMTEERATTRHYRLPSEAQWEWACRAGSTGRWSFSPEANNRVTPEEKKYEENTLSEYGWSKQNSGWSRENSGGMTCAVGKKRASVWGLYDMYGNVLEWCQDWYDKEYYANSATDDPAGSPQGSRRVLRGGGWNRPAWFCRSMFRDCHEPGFRWRDMGFRVCMVIPETAAERAKLANIENTNPQSPTPNPSPAPSHDTTAVQPSPQRERQAAEWVLREGGWVDLLVAGKESADRVNPGQTLPAGDFRVKAICLEQSRLKDAGGLKCLQGLSAIEHVHIEGQDFTDVSLKYLNGLDTLESLNLCLTRITGDGFRNLKPLPKLKILSLERCPIQGSLADLAKSAPNLEILNLKMTQVSDLEGLAGLAASLRELQMQNTQLSDAGARNLSQLKFLERLSVSSPRMTDEGLRAIVESLLKLRTLQIINTPITGAGLENLDRLENLEVLDLHETPLDFKWVRKPGRLTDLKVLNLNCTRISNSGLAQVGKLLSLKELSLWDTPIADADMEHLTRLKSLGNLNLSATRITDAGVKHLTRLESLGNLCLHDTRVGDLGMEHLNSSRLSDIGLDRTRVTDAGMKHLANLQTLGNLTLRGTRVSDAGLEFFAAGPRRQLWVENTLVSAEGVEAFRKRRPDCVIAANPVSRKPDATAPAVPKPDPIEIAPETPEATGTDAVSGWALVSQPAKLAGLSSWTIETRGHHGPVRDVAFSPDGKWIASAGDDGMVRISAWDPTESGPERLRQVRVLMAHTACVRSLSWSPGGRYLASAGNDGTIRVWEPSMGRLLRTIRLGRVVNGVAWSPQGKRLAYIGDTHFPLTVWDIETDPTAQKLRQVGPPGPGLWHLAWSHDGHRLATIGDGEKILVWDADTGAQQRELKGPNGAQRVSWSPDGKLAAWLQDNSAILWDVDSGAALKTFPQIAECSAFSHNASPCTSPDGKWVCGKIGARVEVRGVSGGFDAVMELACCNGFGAGTALMAWTPGSNAIAIRASIRDNPLSALTVLSAGGVSDRKVGPLPGTPILSPDGKFLAVANQGAVEILSADLSKAFDRLAIRDRIMLWSPDGQKLAFGRCGKDAALVYDLATRKIIPLAENCTHHDWFRMAWSSDSKLVACANTEPTVWVCDAQTGALRQAIRGRAGFRGLAWSHDGKLLAIAAQDNQERILEVWDATDGGVRRQRWPLSFDAKSLAFSPDDARLTCGADQNCRVWDIESGRRLLDLATPAEMVVFSSDGRRLGTRGNDNIVRHWDMEKIGASEESASDEASAPVSVVRPHPPSAWQASWSADGSRVAYVTDEYATHLWNAAEGKPIAVVLPIGENLVYITPEGNWRVFPRQWPHPAEFRGDRDIVYVALTEKGEQIMLTPEEFAAKYGWKNDPGKVPYKADEKTTVPATDNKPQAAVAPEKP